MTREEDQQTTAAGDEPLSEELRAARTFGRGLEHDQVRAAAEQALFGQAELARLGRYVVIRRIAVGGMGVVYDGYDPELNRRVALKLVHPDQHPNSRARDRLIGEARALAQVKHPNVVGIHDVLVVDGQVVIVMELVVGETIAAWGRARARSWREVVEVYRQAGRGLAAAHNDGLVHRDFKPANAIVGEDGRIRVLDFGLARLASHSDDEESSHTPDDAPCLPAMTATGEVVGTIAYMSPEQLVGGTATALSDQFSFCVALHWALEDAPPFAGDGIESLLASIRRGHVVQGASSRRIPAWLRALIRRGLADDPAARHSSMDALLRELDHERGWRRWRLPAVVALGIAVVTFTQFDGLANPEVTADPCDGGIAQITPVWNATVRARTQARFDASADAYARLIDDQVFRSLEHYRASWSDTHLRVCRSHRSGAQSDALFDRAQTCLRRRLDALSAAVSVLEAIDETRLHNALDVASSLPRISDCEDPDTLLAEAEPPATDAARAAVAAIRTDLANASALERSGRSSEALKAAATLVSLADAVAYPPVVVEALLLQGRIHLVREEFSNASAALARAESLALSQGLLPAAVEAGARRAYADARSRVDPSALLERLAVFESLSQQLRRDRFARPLLLNTLGVIHMARGSRDDALAAFKTARDAAGEIAEPYLELSNIEMNMAMLTPTAKERERLAATAWHRLRNGFGPRDLDAVMAQLSYAHFISDPARSIGLVREACDLLRDAHADLIYRRADCHWYLGLLTGQRGEDPSAEYELAADLTRSSTKPAERLLGGLASGYAAWHRGDPLTAAAILSTLRDDDTLPESAWTPKMTAHVEFGLALVAASSQRKHAAIAHLDRAIALYLKLNADTENTEFAQRLELARAHRTALGD